MVDLAGSEVADALDDLDDHDEHDDGNDHDLVHATVVAIAHGNVAEAARADGAGHGGVAENGDEHDGHAANDRGQRLGQKDREHDARDARPAGHDRLHALARDLGERLLDHARDEGCGGEHERRDDAREPRRRSHDHARERDDEHHEHDEREGAQDVDDPSEHSVEDGHGAQRPRSGEVEHHAERKAKNVGDGRGNEHHDDGGERTLGEKLAILGDKGIHDIRHPNQPSREEPWRPGTAGWQRPPPRSRAPRRARARAPQRSCKSSRPRPSSA